MKRKPKKTATYDGLRCVAGLLWLLANNMVHGQTAEAFYVSDVDPIVQDKCKSCHRSGGRASYTDLLYTSSDANNHEVLAAYVNSPTPGAKASE